MSHLSPALPHRYPPAVPLARRLAGVWSVRGVTLGLGALVVGGLGEALLFPEATRAVGTLMLAGAMALAVAAWYDTHNAPLLTPATPGAATGRRIRAARLAGIAAALALAGGGIAAALAQPAAVVGWQGVLWLASMALLLLSCARWYPAAQTEADLGPPWTRGEMAVAGGLLALALLTHLAALDVIPWRFHVDESIAFEETMRFYAGMPISLFTTTWRGTGLPSLGFAYTAGVMHLAGPGLAGARAGVALIGALTVIPVYGLARLAWGRVAAGVAAWGVAVSAVYVHYSRVSLLNVTTAFAWAVCFYYLLRGLRSRRPGDFVWAGLAAGLSMYTYYGTRLLPYLLLAFGGYLAVFHFRAFRERAGHLALVGVGFFIGFGPLIAYFLQNPEMWVGRGLQYLNVPPGLPTTWAALLTDWNILAPIVAKNFPGLSVIPSRDMVWYAPLLLPPEAVLLLLGMAVLLWRWRQPAAFLVLLWGAGVVFSGGTLLNRSSIPNFAHWTPALPAFYLAMALPVALGLRAARHAGRRTARLGLAAVAGGLAALTVANGYHYLVVYPLEVNPAHSYEAVQGRFLAEVGAGTRVRFVGASWRPFQPDVAALMAPTTPAGDLLNPGRELPVVGDPAHDLAFVFYNDQTLYLPLVQELYPGGTMRALRTPDGSAEARAYQVPAAVARARYGVTATLTTRDGAVQWRGQVPTVGAQPADVGLTYPLTATWSGALFVERADPLTLQVAGGTATIRVLGAPVAGGTPLTVDAGWVPFSVTMRLDRPASAPLLLWQQGTSPAAEVPTTHLWPLPPDAGLAATFAGAPEIHRVDLAIGAPWFGLVGGRAGAAWPPLVGGRDPEGLPLGPLAGGGAAIRWEGAVYAEGGTYMMELRGDTRARLTLDGTVVIDQCWALPPAPATAPRLITGRGALLDLALGWHPVRLDYTAGPDPGGLEWLWTRPDGVREIVPPSHLRHAVTPDGGIPWPAVPGPITCMPR
jgi:4-amino-4-deoxy-L-arabinose transferase-like glycosyltransferase